MPVMVVATLSARASGKEAVRSHTHRRAHALAHSNTQLEQLHEQEEEGGWAICETRSDVTTTGPVDARGVFFTCNALMFYCLCFPEGSFMGPFQFIQWVQIS